MKRPSLDRCACGKIDCRDMDEARAVHARIWAAKGGEAHVRLYSCRFGSWHWTRELDPTYHQRLKAA